MTDLDLDRGRPHRGGKRRRLVDNACELLHHQGVAGTTLADVAKAADVVVGNIYYYFKSKDDLVQAVIEAHAEAIGAALSAIDQDPDPRARLKAFARGLSAGGDYTARYGCPYGTLCSELDKRDDGLDRTAATLMSAFVEWAEHQFRLLGKGEHDARDLAVTFISVFQGASLLANTFRDPALMAGQARQLEQWVDLVA